MLKDLIELTKGQLEEEFFASAKFMPDAPHNPSYQIRSGSQWLRSHDTMGLRKKFEKFVYDAKRKKARSEYMAQFGSEPKAQ
jgi:hypothetical protein